MLSFCEPCRFYVQVHLCEDAIFQVQLRDKKEKSNKRNTYNNNTRSFVAILGQTS